MEALPTSPSRVAARPVGILASRFVPRTRRTGLVASQALRPLLFLGLIALAVILGGRLDKGAEISGFTRVETNRFLLEYGEVLQTEQGAVVTEWLDPRWERCSVCAWPRSTTSRPMTPPASRQ